MVTDARRGASRRKEPTVTRMVAGRAIIAVALLFFGCKKEEEPEAPIVERSVAPPDSVPAPEAVSAKEKPPETPPLSGAELIERQLEMIKAAQEGRSFNVGVMLEEGLDVNFRPETPGEAALHLAAGNGHLEAVVTLLDRGADVNLAARNDRGDVPLHDAAAGGYAEVVDRLIQAGADVNAKTGDNQLTPLMMASAGGHLETVCLLLKAGADPAPKGIHETRRISFSGTRGSAIDRAVTTSRDERSAEEMAKAERHRDVADLLRSWRKGLKKVGRYCKMDPDGGPEGEEPQKNGVDM